MPTDVRDPFALLGVTPRSSDREIHAAWRLLMKHAHPDAGGSHAYAAALNWAHDTLLDPQARFDFVMRQRQAPPRPPRPEPPPTRSAKPPPPRSTPPPQPSPTAPPPGEPRTATRSCVLRRILMAAVLLALVASAIPIINTVQGEAPSTPVVTKTGILRIAPVKAGEAVPGAGYGADECRARKDRRGATSPDPNCSPGALLIDADRESVCSGQLSQRRPEPMARWAAKQPVLRAYGVKNPRPPAVSFVIPTALGGAWHIDNLWAGRTTATTEVVDKVIALMCKREAPITYRQVIQAAQANALDSLLRRHTPTRSQRLQQPASR